MLSYHPVPCDQYDVCWQLMLAETADYLARVMELMQITAVGARRLFETTGQIIGIYQDDVFAGFYWIEERDRVLHLHGLILKPEFQGKGIGTQVLAILADSYRDRMDAIELGVHASNDRAKKLYERMGYRTVRYLEDLGFYVMQLPLAG